MNDLHKVFTLFKDEFPEISRLEAALGQEIHERGGPLTENVRWLVKIAISATAGHERALETHVAKAREVGVSEKEIIQVLLLLVPSCGFPAFMKAYSVLRKEG
jgi:4-carboxymuconolactone decarboxylase